MKKSQRKKQKKQQRKTTYDPNVQSKYASKKVQQQKGNYSRNSPFRIVEGGTEPQQHEVVEPTVEQVVQATEQVN